MLSKQQVNRYRQDGYLFPLDILSLDAAAEYRGKIENLEVDPANTSLPRPIGRYFRSNAHCVIPVLGELATDPVILDHVEALIGPDILIWGCELFIKEAQSDKIVSWHQDMTYWGLGEEANGDTEHLVTAWLALSPVTVQSGCMRVVSGSHKQDIVEHVDTFSEDNLLSRGQEIAVDVNESEATDIVLRPGQMSLHHGRIFHASGPNTSDDRRIGLVVRYVTPDVRQLVGHKNYAMLARGYDAKGNWNHVRTPDQPFTPHSLEIFEAVTDAHKQSLAAGAAQEFTYEAQKEKVG